MLALCIMTAQKHLSYVASSIVKKKKHIVRLISDYLAFIYPCYMWVSY